MDNIDELLEKAHNGRIQPEELKEVLDRIQKFINHPNHGSLDICLLLQVAGSAGIFVDSRIVNAYKGLIEKLIIFPQNPLVSANALKVLCTDWELTAKYIDHVKSFMKGMEWDKDMDVRVAAMRIAGEYIQKIGNSKCLKILLEIFENRREKKHIREHAYKCISRASGKDWDELQEIDIDAFSQNLSAQETIAKAHKQQSSEYTGELLDKAYNGRIQPEELAEVLDKIQKYYEHPLEYPNHVEIDLLIQVLGYAGASNEYKKLVEKFIIFPQEPSLSVSALDVLCNDWDLTAEYIDQIKAFLRGVEWDESDKIRVKSICVAGEYVRETGDKECLEMLLNIFKNEQEKKHIRELAYSRISRAIGKDWKELEELDINTYPQNLAAQEIIAKAYELLTRK